MCICIGWHCNLAIILSFFWSRCIYVSGLSRLLSDSPLSTKFGQWVHPRLHGTKWLFTSCSALKQMYVQGSHSLVYKKFKDFPGPRNMFSQDSVIAQQCLNIDKQQYLTLYTVFQKKTSTHIIGCKLRNSCLILIIFDTKIPHII